MRSVPRLRSLLFAPAVRPDFVERLGERGADAVVIDCEDATPANAKAEGRANAARLAPVLAACGVAVTVRVNAQPTEWFGDDVREGLSDSLAAVVVPKVESITGLDAVDAALSAAGFDDLGVIAGLETALGVADSRQLLAHPRVVAGYFGAEDFIADMGGVRTASNDEVATARSMVALAGRLAGVPVLDQVVTDFRDLDRFSSECASARALGYAGKLCIHPALVALAHDCFRPTDEALAWAGRVVDACEAAIARGDAAIQVDGAMVDEPVVRRARALLEAD